MGEATGFLQWTRMTPTRRPVRGAPARLEGGLRDVPARHAEAAGRALHGLRHPVLQQRLPARQPDPRLERPRLPRALARRHRPPARHEQLPRVHRSPVPGAVRVGVRARHQRRPGDHQAGRGRDHRPRVGRGLGGAAASRRCAPASASSSSAPARPVWPRRSSSPAPATTWWCSSAPIASAVCCATASPSSRWRSATSTVASRRWRPRAPSSAPTPWSATASTSRCCSRRTTRSCWPAVRPRGATCRCPAASWPASTRRWSTCRWPTRCSRATSAESPIDVAGKHVVIIGGGDTGADCLGTAHRQGAASVTQLEIMPQPPDTRGAQQPVAAVRDGLQGHVGARGGWRAPVQREHRALPRRRQRPGAGAAASTRCEMVDGRFQKIEGTDRELPADFVFLAMGFVGPGEGLVARPARRRRSTSAATSPATTTT